MSETIYWRDLTPAQRDTVVATKVMGWEPKQCPGITDYADVGNDNLVKERGDNMYCLQCGAESLICDELQHGMIPLPHYTTSLDAAWLILETHKFMEAMVSYAEGWKDEAERWQIYSCDLDPHDGLGLTAQGATPAEAICIAALRACGYEVLTEERS